MNLNFSTLGPDRILNAVDKSGFTSSGFLQQLGSYENRVFDIELENREHIIAKFYRPGRWNLQQIQEEHQFTSECLEAGVMCVPALKLKNGEQVLQDQDLFFSLFPKALGRSPDELLSPDLKSIGRALARLHNVGDQKKFKHRLTLNLQDYGWDNLDLLQDLIDPQIRDRYLDAAESILFYLQDKLDHFHFLRLHGDCHRGNLVKREQDFVFVDFDDAIMGPAAQDLWLLSSAANKEESQENLDALLQGYEELRHFNDKELCLFVALRGLRIIHYAAWIAKRWQDPSFPRIFPNFASHRYWSEECENLEQIAWNI